ncbi:ImmA/IrrE family metallo-endopeptidase [bacterium]|nr:MAG: ImmA/IrrE family metallo-endopeptidase [bacterium]
MAQSIYQEAEKYADKIRRELKLGKAPIKDIFGLLEGQGIFVVKMPIGGNGLSGAFFYDKENDLGKILINSNRSKGHQIFSVAHEFCHFLLDKEKQIIIEDDKMIKTDIEKRADCFAANFLMPSDGVHYYIQETLNQDVNKIDDEILVKIRNEFGVSWVAIIYRLHNLGYIFDKHYKEKVSDTRILNALSIQLGFEAEKNNSDGEFKLPTDFYHIAFNAYFNKKISINKLAELLRESYEETKDWVAEIERTKNETNKS